MTDRDRHFMPRAGPRPLDPFDGVVLVDKPSGPTSHDVVGAIRRTFGFRKVGHGGTLDPQATGLLVILIGRGTKLSSWFISSDKTYRGTMRLGAATDSQDAEGRVVREGDYAAVTREQAEAAMRRLTGDIWQTPPMVSAVKVGGVPLYKRARKGQLIERAPKLVHIYEFTLTEFHPPDVGILVRCTKGTYVRTLCAEVGDILGCGAHLAALRRTRSGDISVEGAIRLEELLKMDRSALRRQIVPMNRFRSGVVSEGLRQGTENSSRR